MPLSFSSPFSYGTKKAKRMECDGKWHQDTHVHTHTRKHSHTLRWAVWQYVKCDVKLRRDEGWEVEAKQRKKSKKKTHTTKAKAYNRKKQKKKKRSLFTMCNDRFLSFASPLASLPFHFQHDRVLAT